LLSNARKSAPALG